MKLQELVNWFFLAKLRVTVDGGTNHYVDFVRNNPGQNLRNPDLVTGDFDSCTTESMHYVQNLDCTVGLDIFIAKL